MLVNSLTIGIPEPKGQKFLYVFLNSVSFTKKSNYFLTCRFEPVYPNPDGSGRTLRTEVQQNTTQPQFKTKNFSFKLPIASSPSAKAPTDPFSASRPNSRPGSRRNSLGGESAGKSGPLRGIYLDETNSPTIILQAFDVVQAKEGGSATSVGMTLLPIAKHLNPLLQGEKIQLELSIENSTLTDG
jgi:hypothetical protein